MPNANYVKGRRKEYAIVHREKALGRMAFRTAGSHSAVDVVSIDPEQMTIFLIQSKPESMSEKKKQEIRDDNNKFNGNYDVVFCIE